MSGIVNEVVQRLMGLGVSFSSNDVAREARVSRQAVHKVLRVEVERGRLSTSGRARAVRYSKVTPISQRLEVASVGAMYRLSARLLLMDVRAGEVMLDFTGVMELGDEFLEEVFLVWAPSNPGAHLRVAHLPSRLAAQFFAFAKRNAALRPGERRHQLG